MSKFTEMMKNRRSIYALGENLPISKEEVTALVKEVVRESPTAFNSQTQRVVFLFGDAHKKLWAMTEDALKPLTPAEAFPNTQAKLQGFAAGAGTILFFEDTDIVKNLQDSFPLYADNFPVWSEQATGLTQANVWTALAQENIGANHNTTIQLLTKRLLQNGQFLQTGIYVHKWSLVPLKRQLAKKNTWKIVLVLKNSTKSLL